MKSKITNGNTTLIFNKQVLGKYNVAYYRCEDTGFLQTEEPFWLKEAYSSAITKLDIGILKRNEVIRDLLVALIPANFNAEAIFFDYAGGYGVLTRMMRDKGFRFYHDDKFCENIFARNFDVCQLDTETRFELTTAIEVVEHLANPFDEIQQIINRSENLFFTTELQPKYSDSLKDWWYLAPETGQHVSFYTPKSLEYIAKRLGYHFYSDNISSHLFTKKPLKEDPFNANPPKEPWLIAKMRRKLSRFDKKHELNRQSLLESDMEYIRNLN